MAIEIRRLAPLMAVAAAAACAGGPRTTPPPTLSPACVLTNDDAVAELRIALHQEVQSRNAPVPHNAGEAFIFGQLYEPLIRIDCEGRAVPALATSWAADATGRSWEFTLRSATFEDGVPVTPAAVVAAWSARSVSATGDVGTGDIDVVRTSGDGRVLRVELTAAVNASWFARPELAVSRASDGWPAGTGPYRVRAEPARGTLLLEAREPRRRSPGSISVRLLRDTDPRAPLDAGTDMIMTSDPAVLDYARALGGYVSMPAGWTRTYILASRHPLGSGPMPDPDTIAVGVARDLPLPPGTRRAAPLPEWSAAGCRAAASLAPLPPAPVGTRVARLIAYPSDDETARSAAERIAALAWPVSRSPTWLASLLGVSSADPPVVEPMSETALADALRAGALFAAVLPVARSPLIDCTSVSLSAMPAAAALMRSGWLVTPLLDAPLHVLYRRPPGRLLLDAAGVLHFEDGPP